MRVLALSTLALVISATIASPIPLPSRPGSSSEDIDSPSSSKDTPSPVGKWLWLTVPAAATGAAIAGRKHLGNFWRKMTGQNQPPPQSSPRVKPERPPRPPVPGVVGNSFGLVRGENWVEIISRSGELLEEGDEEGIRLENCIRRKMLETGSNAVFLGALYEECRDELGISPDSKWRSVLEPKQPPADSERDGENTGKSGPNAFSFSSEISSYFRSNKQRRPGSVRRPFRLKPI